MTTLTTPHLLTDEMLTRFDERNPVYDRENRFFDEDGTSLRGPATCWPPSPPIWGAPASGWTTIPSSCAAWPTSRAATALATNMHCYWGGVAADLLRAGDDSCRWVLDKMVEGEVFCALHGEAGNDIPLLLAVASAARVDGGWEISGHKIFGSLAPVWTYGGFHSMDVSDPESPKVVHGFVRRDAKGLQIIDTWDTLGMRATQSQDTVLDRVFVRDDEIVLVCPPGFGGAGLFQVSIFAWALMGFASSYLGAAKRAFDLTVESMPKRSSIALTNSMAHHPGVQHVVSDMRIAYDAAEAMLERTCADWAAGVQHPDWPVRLVATRSFVIDQSFEIVDRALDLSGGAGAFKRNRLEQLFRDVRMGHFHPGNSLLAHELVGKLCLGINPDDPQRWG